MPAKVSSNILDWTELIIGQMIQNVKKGKHRQRGHGDFINLLVSLGNNAR
jgi:hypothetical protein